MNRSHLEDACEEIDAAVFSGDTLWDEEDRAQLKEYVERWQRAIAEHEAAEATGAEETNEEDDCHERN